MDGSSEANPYIDSSVGALVWVRRRNGSWWPGRILGPEELPGSHLLSPRTGTPVKLLGREDGSVDWYNIEKSRRVKAFRCGDFDECIERAKSLASVLTKKREKYARREDAILHALELEKKHIEQNYLLERSFSVDRAYKHLPSFADDDMVLDDDMDGMANHSDFQSDFMDPESSADATQASLDSLFSLQGDKKFLDADWEDDITDTLPRMRGLQDFGLKIAPSKERKPNWSAAYEQNPHVSFTDDEQKMASCITRSTATCPAPISTKTSCTVGAVSKRKRSAQAGYIEDENSFKKRDRRKQMNSVLESSVKMADGVVDLGSKAAAPYFVPSVGRNCSNLLQPKQENNAVMLGNAFQGSSELKPLTSVCGQEFWPASQIDPRPRHELLDSSPVMDKACSSFSDHVKSNCCDGRQYLYADSQMDSTALAGPVFPDPFLQGVPGSRSSMFPRSVYPGSFGGVNDNGFQKAGSLAAPENICSALSNFPVWPYYGGPREVLFEKFGHEMGLRGHVASSRTVGFPDYSFESTVPNTTVPMYPLYNNPLEDNSTFAKNNAGDRDSSLLLAKGIMKADILKVSLKSPKQCLSAVADGDEATDEDEADSFQPPQDPSVGSPKAIGSRDAHCLIKPKHASDGFCDIMGYHEIKSRTTRNGFVSTDGLWNGRQDDDTDIHGYMSRSRVSNDCIALTGIVPTTAIPDVLEEMQEDSETAPSDLKVKKRSTRGFRYSLSFDSSSEEEEPFKERPGSRQPAYQAHVGRVNRFDSGNVQSLDAIDVHNSTWFEVPVEEDEVRNASCHEHLPLMSMMSMLKGTPIVGYAVHVEIVERRYGASQGGASRGHSSGNAVRKPPLQQPVWRTGRRTAMQRVPRSCGGVVSRDSQPERHHQSKHCNSQNRGMRKNGFLVCSSAEKRKSSKKPGLVPQKTRMLSSIAGENDTEHDATRSVGPPLVTCIPVNVIFNRIREVLYRGVNHGASDSDNVS
ncbi:hypothetical protein GOP47_0000425 [Adiantum capillus-veneris]|uniref:PWWP domain-containing protein n=1 Tax=Adiantum capillus-veneris TaxID=13818 RepID=A0A9D4VCZ9_ADICA|nr:hypothetical protein GOP47_0000425 [Adiantum capillus-veneris]